MTQEFIIQFNIKCALFLGAKEERWYPPQKDNPLYGLYYAFNKDEWYPNNEKYHNYSLMKFHSDWNWIMEVVNKICKICFSEDNQSEEDYWKITDAMPYKESVVQAINSFIDQYNKK